MRSRRTLPGHERRRSPVYAGRAARVHRRRAARGVRTFQPERALSQASSTRLAEASQPDVATTESPGRVAVTHRYLIAQNQEWAVVIGIRDFNRIIEQLDECIPSGWADLWLAAAGAAAALGVSALVGALTLPPTLPGTASMLWTLMAAGAAMFCLCMVGYVTQRRNPGKRSAS